MAAAPAGHGGADCFLSLLRREAELLPTVIQDPSKVLEWAVCKSPAKFSEFTKGCSLRRGRVLLKDKSVH